MIDEALSFETREAEPVPDGVSNGFRGPASQARRHRCDPQHPLLVRWSWCLCNKAPTLQVRISPRGFTSHTPRSTWTLQVIEDVSDSMLSGWLNWYVRYINCYR